MWISKSEYDESGPTIVHRKCFWVNYWNNLWEGFETWDSILIIWFGLFKRLLHCEGHHCGGIGIFILEVKALY